MITINENQLREAEVLLRSIPGGINKAIAAALNRAAEGGRTDVSRKARERYHVKSKDITSTIRLTKAAPDNLSAIVLSSGRPLALTKFKVTPSKPPQKKRTNPIIARVVKGEGGQIRGAFVARMQSGHVGVFHRAGQSRYPIIQRYGPSVPQMLGHRSVTEYVEQRAQEQLEARLDHEIGRLLRGARR